MPIIPLFSNFALTTHEIGEMPGFKIHCLGCGSAKPTPRHLPSCTVVEHNDTLYMIDCGEGAQRSFQQKRLKFSRLRHIFLTHLHGDHVLGLPGLISSLALGDTGGKLTIHTFAEGEKILRTMFDFFAPELSYDLEFNIIKPADAVILETSTLTVRTVKLKHRVPCVGFIFEEKPKMRHIIRDMIDFHGVPTWQINCIKAGEDFTKPDGTVVPNNILTSDADPSLSYAHIGDTIYMPELAEKIGPVNLLYHETTYLDEHQREARMRFHSTARQAGMMAKACGAARLLTGHYSSRYRDEQEFLRQASEEFPNVILGKEGDTVINS